MQYHNAVPGEIIRRLLLILAIASSFIQAQNLTVQRQALSRGVPLEVTAADLAGARVLVVSDAAGHNWKLAAASLNGESVWTRQSGDVAEHDGVLHWFGDEASGQLLLDLRHLGNEFSGNTVLTIHVTPESLHAHTLDVSLSRSNSYAADQAGRLEKIKDITVEIN